jgi:hypothetical protein
VWVPRVAPEINLDEVQRQQLESLIRASSATQSEVLRARIILLVWKANGEEILAKIKAARERLNAAT